MFVQPPLTSSTGFTIGHGGITFSGGTASLSGSTDGTYSAAYTALLMSTDNFSTQMTLSGTIGAPDFGANTRCAGPGVRLNSSFTQGVFAAVDTSGVYIQTKPTASGALTTRASAALTTAVGDVILLTAFGYLYTAYRNGAFVCSWDDTGHVCSLGSSFRCGGLLVSRANFANSSSLTTMRICDKLYETPANNFVTMGRSSIR